jgi:molybdopterin biosynthesis enzyme
MALANGLLVIPEGDFEIPAGAQVQAILLDDPVHRRVPAF